LATSRNFVLPNAFHEARARFPLTSPSLVYDTALDPFQRISAPAGKSGANIGARDSLRREILRERRDCGPI